MNRLQLWRELFEIQRQESTTVVGEPPDQAAFVWLVEPSSEPPEDDSASTATRAVASAIRVVRPAVRKLVADSPATGL